MKKYILIKSKKTKKTLGAIPIKMKATTSKIKIALSQLKKDFMAKVVSGETLKKYMIKKVKKPIKRKVVRRKKK